MQRGRGRMGRIEKLCMFNTACCKEHVKELFLYTKGITNCIPASLLLASWEKNLFFPLRPGVSSSTLQRRTKCISQYHSGSAFVHKQNATYLYFFSYFIWEKAKKLQYTILFIQNRYEWRQDEVGCLNGDLFKRKKNQCSTSPCDVTTAAEKQWPHTLPILWGPPSKLWKIAIFTHYYWEYWGCMSS